MNKPQLFFLHFAGGSSYSYQFMSPFLKEFEIISLELPGRGKRGSENLIHDFQSAANDFYSQIIKKLSTSNFIIYGHSMGALLALQVVHMLEKSGNFPLCLFVSGNPGPGIPIPVKRHLLDRDSFIEELNKIGGLPDGFTDNKDLFEFYEPILRADFQITETNSLSKEQIISTPIYAMMGTTEMNTSRIENWMDFTTAVFNFSILEGNHFFIYDHPAKIANIIKLNYSKRLHLRQA